MQHPGTTREDGFAYLGLLVAIAIMGVVQAALCEAWHADARREKEQQLLFAGGELRAALELYALRSPPNAPRQPQRLDDLLKDPRQAGTARYLRKLYPDPITGKAEWGLVRGAGGEIHGVYSLSEQRPLKQAGFARAYQRFAGAQKYSEWVFMAAPGRPGR
jgi:type II secretory pathway pseudopilin PulG